MIYDLIYKLAGDRTVIFISHRLGFCKNVDRIVVLNDGLIVEEGTHDELIAQNGIYEQMYKIQQSWYE